MKNPERHPEPGLLLTIFSRLSRQVLTAILMLLALIISAWIGAAQVLNPPPVVPAAAPAEQFSGERAFLHLEQIASEPHTVGSPAQARVRAYLVKQIQALGLTPEIQNTTAALAGEQGVFASNLANIVVRIPGTNTAGSVAVMAHYDSQPNTPGASDNGAAVAGLLETMRAIRSGPQLRNDLLFIFTDAEEVDAQGAEAFFWQHPWAKDIRLLINFEAAGSTGSSLLLETSPKNRGVVEGFLKAVPHPVSYSFMTQLLEVMPLGTDMTVFSENGVPGLSPMFGWGYHVMYHSLLDNTSAIDPRSVQHQGENGLGLARYFASRDLAALITREDQVFFTLLPGLTVQYPSGWSLPLAFLAMLCVVALIAYGLRLRKLSLLGILGGFALTLLLVILPLVVAAVVWLLIVRLHPQFWRNVMGSPYQSDLYLLGLVALVAAVDLALLGLFRRKASLIHISSGSILLWLILGLLTGFSLPGMSYLFTWPVIATSLTLILGLYSVEKGKDLLRTGALFFSGIITVLLVAPIFVLMFMLIGFWFLTMGPGTPFILVPLAFLALLFSILSPHFDHIIQGRGWLAPGFAGLLSVILLVTASLASNFNASQPRQNGVWYQLDADSQAAAWYSFGSGPDDPWTDQFFPGKVEPVDPSLIYAMLPGNPTPPAAFRGSAPLANLPAPELKVVSDQTSGSVRSIKMQITSPRVARGLLVKVSGAPVLAASVNGLRRSDPAWVKLSAWYLRFYGLADQALELQLDVEPSVNLTVTVTDQSDGLPDLPGVTYSPRSADMMPFALAQEYMPYPETTSVTKIFTIP